MDSSDTPPPAASPPSQPSPSPKSGLGTLLSKLPGTAVQLYALHLLSPSLLVSCADETRFKWALLGFVVVVVPTFAWSAFDIARQFLASKRPS